MSHFVSPAPDLCLPVNSAINYTAKTTSMLFTLCGSEELQSAFKNVVSRERLPVYILDIAFQILIYQTFCL